MNVMQSSPIVALAYELSDAMPTAGQQTLVVPPSAAASDATSAISSTLIVGDRSTQEELDDSLEAPRRRQLQRKASKTVDTIPDSEGDTVTGDFDSPDEPARKASSDWAATLQPASPSQVPPAVEPPSPDPMDVLRKTRAPAKKKRTPVADSEVATTAAEPIASTSAAGKRRRAVSSSPASAPAPGTDDAHEAARHAVERFSDADDDFAPGVEAVDAQHDAKKRKKAPAKRKATKAGSGKKKKGAAMAKRASTPAPTLDDDEAPIKGKSKATGKGKGKGKADEVSPEMVDSEDLAADGPGPSNATTVVLLSSDAPVAEVPELLAAPKGKKKRSRTGSNFSVDLPVAGPSTTTAIEDEAPAAVKPKRKAKRVPSPAPETVEPVVEPDAAAEPASAPIEAEVEVAPAKNSKRKRATVVESDEEPVPASESEAEEVPEKPVRVAKKPPTKKGKAAVNENKENEVERAPPQAPLTTGIRPPTGKPKVKPEADIKPWSIKALTAKHSNGFRPSGLSRRARPSVGLLQSQRPVVAKPPVPQAIDRKKKKPGDGDTSEDTDEERERKRRERLEEGWSDEDRCPVAKGGLDAWGEDRATPAADDDD